MIRQFTISHSDTGVFTVAIGPWITATCVMTVWYVCCSFYHFHSPTHASLEHKFLRDRYVVLFPLD